MINLQQIKSAYPKNLQIFDKFILQEYLQYKILDAIYQSRQASKLVFMGGTCLRLIYGNQRFSEDLDFDNLGLDKQEFSKLIEFIKRFLNHEGFEVEMRQTFKAAYHCYIKFPRILFELGLTKQKTEKILIRLDTVSQNFIYQPTKKLINKFDVFNQILVFDLGLLLSSKILAAMQRKTTKGRDFFDIVYLISLTKPNMSYLQQKLGVSDGAELQKLLLNKCKKLNFEDLARDVEPFLFDPRQKQRVLSFKDVVKQAGW